MFNIMGKLTIIPEVIICQRASDDDNYYAKAQPKHEGVRQNI